MEFQRFKSIGFLFRDYFNNFLVFSLFIRPLILHNLFLIFEGFCHFWFSIFLALMYRLSIKRSRKPEYALSREHHRRLQRIQETARRERQQQLEDSILHALESTNADTCNSTFVEAGPSTRDDCRAQSETAQYQCTENHCTNHCTNSINEDGISLNLILQVPILKRTRQ